MIVTSAPVSPEYLKDESRFIGHCEDILFVKTPDDIKKALMSGASVTAQGARTGITGAAVPNGGIVLNFSGFSGFLGMGVDSGSPCLDVLPGTTLGDIQKHAGTLFFAPDPTERTATIGGMFATNAGGVSSLLYGRTASHVLSADIRLIGGGLIQVERGKYIFGMDGTCLLPDGRVLRVEYPETTPLSYPLQPRAGSDLLDLFAGSEGMLGIVESLRLRLTPVPAHKWSILFFLSCCDLAAIFADGVDTLRKTTNACKISSLEYIDNTSLRLFAALKPTRSQLTAVPYPPPDTFAVLAELSSNDENSLMETLEALLSLFTECGGNESFTWAASSASEIEKLRLLRHGIPEAVNAALDANRRNNARIVKLAADLSFPNSCISELLPDLHGILDDALVPYALFGHIGARSLHINLLPENGKQFDRCSILLEVLTARAAAENGMIAAENGIGKLKRAIIRDYLTSDQLMLMKTVKEFFDPGYLLNPGNMF